MPKNLRKPPLLIIAPGVSLPIAASATCPWIPGTGPYSRPQTTGGEMNIIGFTKRMFLLLVVSVGAPGAFGAGSEITTLNAAADGETVRIEIGLTSPVKPTVHMAGQMGLLVLDFPNVALQAQSRRIVINQAGVSE